MEGIGAQLMRKHVRCSGGERGGLKGLIGLFSVIVACALLGGCATITSSNVPVSQGDSVPALSQASMDYAKQLGGSSHEGESLYLVVGARVASESEAQSLLDAAIPLFGDMQSYFIVQRSDAFDGLGAGDWVVVEAYRDEPADENVGLAQRAFPDATVMRVTVRTADPVPVYEDVVGE